MNLREQYNIISFESSGFVKSKISLYNYIRDIVSLFFFIRD